MSTQNTRLKAFSVATASLMLAMMSSVGQAKGPNLLCCANDNGTFHPVSSNGPATEHCAETWPLPDGENPAKYCELGPQAQSPEAICAARDSTTCFDPSPSPTVFFCYLALSQVGEVVCNAQVFGS